MPMTSDLEHLLSELKERRQYPEERRKKAEQDIHTLDESYRRLTAKEKGKAKAVERVKRERGFTPLPGQVEEVRASPHPQPGPSAPPPRMASTPVASVVPAPPPPPAALPRKSDSKNKKKKRKRDVDSDDDRDSQRLKPTPPSVHTTPQPAHALPKAAKPSAASANPSKLSSGPDWTVPPITNLLPARPKPAEVPLPGPREPSEVTEDFSKAKQPSQILINTFYTSIEPYIRPLKESDLGFLSHTASETEPYIMPRLGRHYTEIWEEEDVAAYGGVLPSTQAIRASTSYGRPAESAPVPRWDPATLNEDNLLAEERGHGPLTERLVSALLPVEDSVVWKGVKAAEEAMEGRHGVGVGNAAGRQVIVEDLEKRIRDSLRFHKLLEKPPDFSDPLDDPIATALRQAQEQLRTVVATNKARKARLAAVARDRIGYQEYIDLRDSIDKNISTLYTKLQKKEGPKAPKNKKKKGSSTDVNGAANGSANGAAAPTGTWPASAGLGPDEDNLLKVPEQLSQLVATRRKWVDVVGGVFEEKQKESPGRIYGLPKNSLYKGIEEEVQELLRAGPEGASDGLGDGGLRGKGKARQLGPDNMDIG